ncbi:hypothetical protein PCC7424_5867 (plasmid) [Gloeothece citriformis PCC 7424]|uniref:Uncharacterized protein n=1 Tax=Gloeothece citriformis (strain PCC 7424) TaxID=65393 RepID=B7KM94_GLOC7|nr:hypothetical protein [Gloeothece citriformis]ACK73916.1 hypothetical protein PCC7424_5867 [Gloeothece citriformis PCC 7424]
MNKTHLWPEQTVEIDGITTISVTIETPDKNKNILWYQIPAEHSSLLTPNSDPFVAPVIFLAMSQKTDLVIHGEVSPSLLRNLEEFQAVWGCWRPNRYRTVEMTADVEREPLTTDRPQKAISAFSGGLDSCFTAFRHTQGKCGRNQRPLQAGLMVQGFDIALSESEAFEGAAQKSKLMLNSLGLELITMKTNFREILGKSKHWEDVHGAAIASALMLLQGGYSIGLIPSSDPYNAVDISWGWGSNPLSDPLLSSDSFNIFHDGGAFSRPAKLQLVAQWPKGLENLRICWEGKQKDRNCGYCEKCVQAILTFRVLGLNLPPCFNNDVNDEEITRVLKKDLLIEYAPILAFAKANCLSDSWVTILREFVIANAVTEKHPLCATHPHTCLRCARMTSLAGS